MNFIPWWNRKTKVDIGNINIKFAILKEQSILMAPDLGQCINSLTDGTVIFCRMTPGPILGFFTWHLNRNTHRYGWVVRS